MKFIAAIILSLPLATTAAECIPIRTDDGAILRSRAQVHRFQKANPCPSTGKISGRCPGYVVDHVIPLCACGQDDPTNMQWQTIVDARKKDRIERTICRGKV